MRSNLHPCTELNGPVHLAQAIGYAAGFRMLCMIMLHVVLVQGVAVCQEIPNLSIISGEVCKSVQRKQ